MIVRFLIGLALLMNVCNCSNNQSKESPASKPEQYELKVNPGDRYSGINFDHGPTDVINYTDQNGNKYHYGNITTTITNDTTLPIQVKINFSVENYYRSHNEQSVKAFIIPETLTPNEELKRRFDVPLNGTVTLNPSDSYISDELRKFLETQLENSTTLYKTINPKEKCVITIGILTDSRYDGPGQLALVSKGHRYPFLANGYPHEWHIDKSISTNNSLSLFLGLDFFRFASAEQYKGYSLIPCGQISFSK